MNARMRVILNGWGAIFALSFGLLNPSSAAAEPIRFSTSGQFDLATGTVDLAGVSDAAPEGKNFAIGAVPVAGVEARWGACRSVSSSSSTTTSPPSMSPARSVRSVTIL